MSLETKRFPLSHVQGRVIAMAVAQLQERQKAVHDQFESMIRPVFHELGIPDEMHVNIVDDLESPSGLSAEVTIAPDVKPEKKKRLVRA